MPPYGATLTKPRSFHVDSLSIAASPKVVPFSVVIKRSATPLALNATSQYPPTIGYDWTLRMVISTAYTSSLSCGTFHFNLSPTLTLYSGSPVTSTLVSLTILYSFPSNPASV